MTEGPVIRVLVVEDDEEDYFLTAELLKEVRTSKFLVERAPDFDSGLQAMVENSQDVCLVDYRLGGRDGIELLQTARQAGAEAPVILLTGAGGLDADHAAMKAGAADYLVKGTVEASHLERVIRYALERKGAASAAAFEQARLAAFGAQVGLALTRRAPLSTILENCARAMVQFLNVNSAQIFTYDPDANQFELQASVGGITDESRQCAQNLECGDLLQRKPVLQPDLTLDAVF